MSPETKILNLTPIGMVFHLTKTADQTNSQFLEMVWELMPQADGTPVHVHPQAAERYKVLDGQLEVNVAGQWQLLQTGDELTVPAGVAHTFRNPLRSITRVQNTHSPAMQFGTYFTDLARVVDHLTRGTNKKLPMNLKTVIYLSLLMKKYPQEIVSVQPPNVIVTLLAWVGKLSGLHV